MLSPLRAKLEINRLIRDWRFWCNKIADAAASVLGKCEVYVFGSVIYGHATGGSDVDVLIVADQLPKDFRARGFLKAEIEQKAGLPLYHPFELHLVTRNEAEENPIYREVLKSGLRVGC
ncbi:MAG: nucleotidyltransferase domain-containing protein [Candidatus Bathyarchaeota archaeon]|nr:nucleotidyltransferase domain-containing protein [Candidatus Bathyarchaeota archaeon]